MQLFAENIIDFYKSVQPPISLPGGIEVLYPQKQKEVIAIVEEFYKKYYSDKNQRTLLFGINPGRFGAGITGVNFTAPRQLKENCGIGHSLKMHSELSAEFIYEVIDRCGGVEKFYKYFFITSVSPLGYIRNGVNLNYYDDKKLQEAVTPFIVDCVNRQLTWNVNREKSICVGGEKNFKFFAKLNDEHGWFNKVIPLPHPRFILQYRRKQKETFLRMYMDVLNSARDGTAGK